MKQFIYPTGNLLSGPLEKPKGSFLEEPRIELSQTTNVVDAYNTLRTHAQNRNIKS